MKKISMVIMLSITIIILLIAAIYQHNKYNKERNLRIVNESLLFNVKSDLAKFNQYKASEYLANGLIINDIKLQALNGNNLLLSSVVKQPTLIFSFSEVCCTECVDNYLNILNQLNDSVGNGQLIIIANYDKLKKLEIKKVENKIKLNCYNTSDSLNLPFNNDNDKHDKPFFIVVDKNLVVSFSRIGWPVDSISNPYFDRVISLLK